MIWQSCLRLLVLFTTTVGCDDYTCLGDVRARLPLPRLQTHSCRDFGLSSFFEPAWLGRTYSPSDTNAIRSPFLCTVRTHSDTNATRYPQFQYCINILVGTPGVALPVPVQSSFGFLTTRLDTQHRFDACSKHYILCTGGGITPPPALNR